jgi:predicted membrane protein
MLYIDPGSGALIWQTILAFLLGVGFYFRSWWQRLVFRIFRKDRNKA